MFTWLQSMFVWSKAEISWWEGMGRGNLLTFKAARKQHVREGVQKKGFGDKICPF